MMRKLAFEVGPQLLGAMPPLVLVRQPAGGLVAASLHLGRQSGH